MPPPSNTTPVSFTADLPKAADVVVIGGGVIGVSTAYFLAKAGVSVLLCEKGRVAGEQSSRNWGWVRQQGRDRDELPIMMESIRIWDDLTKDVGEDLGFRREGVVYLAADERELASYEQWLNTVAKPHQLDTRLLNAAEASKLIPDLAGPWKGVLHTASDGRAEPFTAVPALARVATAKGATIIEDCAVRTIETTGGTVSHVVTERGEVRCQRVVLAGGAWSSLFLLNGGIDLPQLAVKATVARTEPADTQFIGNAASHNFAFRKRADGGYSLALTEYHEHFVTRASFRHLKAFWPLLRQSWRDTDIKFIGDPMATPSGERWHADEVSPFEHIRVLDPKPDPRVVARITRQLGKNLPSLKNTKLAESWSGMIDTTPDVVPVIDEMPGVSGYFVATGFSGHGFGIGPGAGRVIADLMQGKPAGHDLSRFRFSRFIDGSRLSPGPTI